ncbi:MAG: GGDEF domain-containing protein, partial [Sulfurimonas sp.]|nr:GGDEF domain-containing protein [Sulfurimonas sp.]
KYIIYSKTDLKGVVTEVSDAFCEISQYTRDELLGKSHNIIRHPDMPKSSFKDMWETIENGKVWNGEVKNRKKDGSYYWVEVDISPEFDENGNMFSYIAIRHDITDKKKIEEIAITDGLTTLYNRRHFDNIFPQQIALCKREKSLLAFVLIDIDYFKQYNDTYGHQDGDTALKLVAQSLHNTIKRPNDYIFRLGGEEFGLIYHTKDADEALLMANKARENIENLKIGHTGNSASKFVTISSGLYIIRENDTSTIDEIYKKTDEALYISKQNGRNQVSYI